uniref:Disease resistance protein rpm1-like n=1 Tax=Trifolium pratense TaxID=57577 RepID=A0A2K3N6H4_TRIPR
MGGLGKTTLAKQVYDDPEVKKHFKIHAWVNLSQSSKIEELLKDLVQQLHILIGKPVPEEIGMMKNDELKRLIKNLLQSRYLIVLDDVWYATLWNAVKLALPNNNLGSRVILTTRKTNITELGKDFHLEFLPEKEAQDLFFRKTFQGNSCPPDLKEVCLEILQLCGGLPLAIVAISGVMATRKFEEEWKIVCRSIGSEIRGNDKLEDMKKVLSLSFNELPYYLKSCLLYLSVFPEFHPIEHMRLIRLWIAEGFVNGEDGKTLEEVADSYLKELLNRSFLQVVEKTSDGRMKTCRMHDLLREIVNLKSMDQNFATIAREDEQDTEWTEQVRRLSIINSFHNVLKQNKTIFKLRSLLMFALSDSLNHFSIRELCSSTGVNLLRVLDLQDAPLEDFPAEIVDLYLLKYLSLKNTKVKSIPCSIKKLKYLETLDLKHTYVTELPAEIVELERLRHLLVYRYDIVSYAHFHAKHGFKVAAPIGNMQSLQKLCYIEVDQGSGAIMVELGKLTQLRRLGIQKLRKEDGPTLCSSIEKMIHLRSVSISTITEDEILDIHAIKPPRYLKQLYLSGCLEKFPQWIKSCNNLVRVFLKWSRLKEDPLVYLQGLPNLRHLEFLQVYVGETLCFKAEGFPSLKVLGLDDLEVLKSITIEKGAMQGLKKLIIQRCGSFKNVPLGIEHLTKLKSIEFFDMPDELLMKLRPNVGRDFWRVQHVPTVYTSYRRDGGWDVYSLETFGERETDSNHSSAKRSLELPTLWKV